MWQTLGKLFILNIYIALDACVNDRKMLNNTLILIFLLKFVYMAILCSHNSIVNHNNHCLGEWESVDTVTVKHKHIAFIRQ